MATLRESLEECPAAIDTCRFQCTICELPKQNERHWMGDKSFFNTANEVLVCETCRDNGAFDLWLLAK